MGIENYDIVVVSDFRLSGATTRFLAEELKIQSAAGYRTGLLQCGSQLASDTKPWDEAFLNLIEAGMVDVIPPGVQVATSLAVVRSPAELSFLFETFNGVAAAVLVVADQVVRGGDGIECYDPNEVGRAVESFFGIEPVWTPTDPVVRDGLVLESAGLKVLAWDWVNIFEQPKLDEVRVGFDMDRPVIGRHSGPGVSTWPSRAWDIEAAYPSYGDFRVRVRGGVEPVEALVGKVPSNWEVVSADTEVRAFLRSLDFWVFFHSSDHRETQGQAIMEALGAGLVVILPPHLERIFGDAALYGRPQDVTYLVRQFMNGRLSYEEQSTKALQFASARNASLHLERLSLLLEDFSSATNTESLGLGEKSFFKGRLAAAPAHTWDYYTPNTNLAGVGSSTSKARPVVLVATPNEVGFNHLSRMLGVARAGRGSYDTVFVSASRGVSLVERFGFRFEYVPDEAALGTSPAEWNRYFVERFKVTVETFRPDAVVFDGIRPFAGILNVLDEFPTAVRVWMRPGMWGQSVDAASLEIGGEFDLILEPGDYAENDGRSPTKNGLDAVEVPPVTVLDRSETLTREEARRELGFDDSDRLALISLGDEADKELMRLQKRLAQEVGSHGTWTPVIGQSPGSGDGLLAADSISYFPMSRYLRAFDFTVSVPRYEMFADAVGLAVPTIWVTENQTTTDDAKTRARWAEDALVGVSASASNWTAVKEALALMMDDKARTAFKGKCRRIVQPNGAHGAAKLIEAVIRTRRSVTFGYRGR